jgi:hypothetical protein
VRRQDERERAQLLSDVSRLVERSAHGCDKGSATTTATPLSKRLMLVRAVDSYEGEQARLRSHAAHDASAASPDHV